MHLDLTALHRAAGIAPASFLSISCCVCICVCVCVCVCGDGVSALNAAVPQAGDGGRCAIAYLPSIS